MLETPHVLVGAAIAAKVTNPALAIPFALGSHFLLDKIPHWNPHTYTEAKKYGKPRRETSIIAGFDSSLALFSGLTIAYFFSQFSLSHALVIVTACFFSVLPDISKIPYYYFGRKKGLLKKWVDIERAIQVEVKSPLLGILTQLSVSLAAIWWIIG